ncbi:glycoside hydrolase family 16 protein [Plicaturopsis crispa FD-325 SS-3]|nr:glycoside hydrolase family 16 protein [Plicaturopsis crispa FD-325 SS-3]
MSRPPIRASSAGYLRESFAHPPTRPFAAYSTTSPGSFTNGVGSAKRPMSTMLSESTPISKPWLESRDPFARIAYFLTYAVIFLGFAGSAIRCYFGYVDVPMIKSNLCLVFEDDFDTGGSTEFSSSGKWFQEIELGGFGNGEFEITTSSTNNSFVNDGKLYIVPTLTSDNIGADAIFNGYTYNLTDCTYNDTQNVYPAAVTASSGSSSFNAAAYYQACGAVSNSSTDAVIPPAQSARLSTRNSASIRYGKVEVRAKLPTGDWLWPAIWMLPVNNTYGAWPMSGEIDIMESRGNGISYSKQGSNYVRASLNWGPVTFINAVAKTFGWWTQKRSSYADDFHTYTLEWTEDFLRTYADTRLHGTLSLRFNEPFFDRGDFPAVVQNGTDSIVLENPWVNGTNAAPFDQPFYLILDVAVGGTSGWFPDNADNKPWIDGSLTAMHDFAKNQDTWYSTWPQDPTERGMVVDSVKMWQQC